MRNKLLKTRKTLLNQRGLTLVEIIVVLVILSILIAFLTGGLFKQAEGAKAKMSQMQMEKLKGSLNQYQLMYNQLPSSLQGLSSCSEQTGQACVPLASPDDLKDAWGTPLVYSSSGRSYTIKSLGADRKEGGTGTDGDFTIQGP